MNTPKKIHDQLISKLAESLEKFATNCYAMKKRLEMIKELPEFKPNEIDLAMNQARKAHFHNMLAMMARQEAYWRAKGKR